ncbi:hypothetical protein fugu_004334 [Takifugu bimaculatus]|uniref:BMP-2-inducible protein kinase C-terminal domain-containing protein n=1 Tax=Takifugu bimaculatus TaxID=433685 RepID=A0A4Z2BG10_9TELE|nr:hypothetical protein fugu_004334 [Takifugu bimaculatus]
MPKRADLLRSGQTREELAVQLEIHLKEQKPSRKSNCRPGEESDSDFESDPPSPKSSEDEEPEEEEGLNSEHGEDTEPENIGQRPLLMDSEEEGEEDEDKHSSDSDCDPSRQSQNRGRRGCFRRGPVPGRGRGGGAPTGPLECSDIFAKAPFRQVSQEQKTVDEFDVFTKAPFNRNLSKPSKSTGDVPMGQTPPVSPDGIDIFGFSPFDAGTTAPPPSTSRSAEDIFRTALEEASSPQQQRLKQRSLQKLSSRQRKTKQEAAAGCQQWKTPPRHADRRPEDKQANLPHARARPEAQEGRPARLSEQQRVPEHV